jgi:hypothetical protein
MLRTALTGVMTTAAVNDARRLVKRRLQQHSTASTNTLKEHRRIIGGGSGDWTGRCINNGSVADWWS